MKELNLADKLLSAKFQSLYNLYFISHHFVFLKLFSFLTIPYSNACKTKYAWERLMFLVVRRRRQSKCRRKREGVIQGFSVATKSPARIDRRNHRGLGYTRARTPCHVSAVVFTCSGSEQIISVSPCTFVVCTACAHFF